MNLQEYRESKLGGAIPPGISKRWQTRVVAQHLVGRSGAADYLARYGRGIKEKKLAHLARQAEQSGDAGMALHFWEQAYEMETGKTPGGGLAVPDVPEPEAVVGEMFPPHLRPGKLVTMQPVDAPRPRSDYVRDDRYWGQPKVYGHRLVVFATPDQAWYQSRSLKLNYPPSARIDEALRGAARKFGPFILDGEKHYLDCAGQERMTAAQAATVNVQRGEPSHGTPPTYAIFRCLYADGDDLTEAIDAWRIQHGETTGSWLETHWPGSFRFLDPARTTVQKAALVCEQRREGREGEIWFQPDAPYMPGKGNKYFGELVTVRTKYRQTLIVFVTALTPSDKRLFGAIEVATHDACGDVVHLGRVGTGFTRAQQTEIAGLHERGPLVIEIITQGLTENMKLVHGSFVAVRGDKKPEDCAL